MLILASSSPRRIGLLSELGYDFTVMPADIDESGVIAPTPEGTAMLLAQKKAGKVFGENPEAVVIGADTVVSIGGRILGKPADEMQAKEMLWKLSGNTHEVFTGVCILGGGGQESFFSRTAVRFRPLDGETINRYVATGEPMDKAGAYGIQKYGALLVEGISGDYFNVVGLPVAELAQRLAGRYGISVL